MVVLCRTMVASRVCWCSFSVVFRRWVDCNLLLCQALSLATSLHCVPIILWPVSILIALLGGRTRFVYGLLTPHLGKTFVLCNLGCATSIGLLSVCRVVFYRRTVGSLFVLGFFVWGPIALRLFRESLCALRCLLWPFSRFSSVVSLRGGFVPNLSQVQ